MHFAFCRVLQDRREQAKQDLKGLEETVVSYWHVHLELYSIKRQIHPNDKKSPVKVNGISLCFNFLIFECPI